MGITDPIGDLVTHISDPITDYIRKEVDSWRGVRRYNFEGTADPGILNKITIPTDDVLATTQDKALKGRDYLRESGS